MALADMVHGQPMVSPNMVNPHMVVNRNTDTNNRAMGHHPQHHMVAGTEAVTGHRRRRRHPRKAVWVRWEVQH
jgi:hypothetical protein